MSLRRNIITDYRRYRAAGASALGTVLLTQGFWASIVYRCQHAAQQVRWPVLRPLLRALGLCAQKWVEIVTGISLPTGLAVGEGLYIGHFGGIILSPEARLGRNCNLSQGVTLGVAGRAERRGAPVLGDRVYVGADAVLLGRIQIGDDAAIGAGAVVTRSVPPRAVVVGNPARVISHQGSFDFIQYDGMETDPARGESLVARDSAGHGADAAPKAGAGFKAETATGAGRHVAAAPSGRESSIPATAPAEN